MTLPRSQILPDVDSRVLQDIADHAEAVDRGTVSMVPDLAALYDAGLLAALVAQTGVGGDTGGGVTLLRRIGRASLSVGRIVEGHANALRLIQLYATPLQLSDCRSVAAQGGLFGVWGAASDRSFLTFAPTDETSGVLTGARAFCSGLGMLSMAVLPVATDEGPLLLLARADDPERADASVWQVSGMRGTESGRYDLSGVRAEVIGRPGDYLREPHFEGGIWRYSALHCGGLEALAEAVRQHLAARDQSDHPQQAERLAQLVLLAQTARLWVEASAGVVERAALSGGETVVVAVTQALLARQAVETACQSGIALAERAMGTAAFASGSNADRIRRDLPFFLRQANLDGKMAQASRALCDHPAPVGEMW